MAAIYEFAEEMLPDGRVRLTWKKNGRDDPLNYWYGPPADLEKIKAVVGSGELEVEFESPSLKRFNA